MKFLVPILSFVALCAGDEIPMIPGDNSHYIEGVSRYFWIPDGNGVPILVDTHDDADLDLASRRSGSDNNQYWLFTRKNPTTAQKLVNGDLNSVSSSNYVATKPLLVISHGWRSNGKSDVNTMISYAALDADDINVIVLDWNKEAGKLNYFASKASVPEVGKYLGNFLVWLIKNTRGNWNKVHLVGHSLGAHVVGNAGRQTGGLPARITALDPAKPKWSNNPNKITKTDGVYVEAIHTDGGCLGIKDAIGNADFYPNGGESPQPGCRVLSLSPCSHTRAYQLFASTVQNNQHVGKKCSSVDDASKGKNCSGPSLRMGNNILSKRGSGIYYLTTTDMYPYYKK